ncbi:MAG: non-canonical purine NTP pyrophosphatase, partial [Bacteroidetes bacterium]|nr:non-canonical purine NTP pyrophosphatase [Bacteroidota bacterium]
DKTFAEMTSDEKNKISHRYLALQKMMQFLKEKQNI